MKLFIYDAEEAIKNGCHYGDVAASRRKNYAFIGVCGAYSGISLFVFLFGSFFFKWMDYIPTGIWIAIWIISSLSLILLFHRIVQKYYWAQQTAFIKDDDTFWRVKLVYVGTVTGGTITEGSAHLEAEIIENTLEQERIINEKKTKEESYIKAFEEARMGDVKITHNDWLDTVSPLIFNDSIKLSRLDDLTYIKEDSKCYTYMFKNHKGKERKLIILKAYPELKEEIAKTIIRKYQHKS